MLGLPHLQGILLSEFPWKRIVLCPWLEGGVHCGCFAPCPPDAAVLAPGLRAPVRVLHPIGGNPTDTKFLQKPLKAGFLKKKLLKNALKMHVFRHEKGKIFCKA